jgi:hypothetical protein
VWEVYVSMWGPHTSVLAQRCNDLAGGRGIGKATNSAFSGNSLDIAFSAMTGSLPVWLSPCIYLVATKLMLE